MKDDPKTSPTYCSLLWNHLFVGPGGKIKPCCRFTGNKSPDSWSLAQTTLSQVFSSSELNELREKSASGQQIAGCIRCYQEEKADKYMSLRQYYNQRPELANTINYTSPDLRYIELSADNLCNLACVMCDSRYSTKWISEHQKVFGSPPQVKNRTTFELTSLDGTLDNIRHIKMTGGEPFMVKSYQELLEQLCQSGRASQIDLDYSTNMTVKPSPRLIELWSQFKTVEIAASIDGFKAVNEFVRYPSNWESIEDVTEQLMILSQSKEHNLHLGLRATVSVYNILSLPQLFHWWLDRYESITKKRLLKPWINATHVTYPALISLPTLTENLKAKVAKKISTAQVNESTSKLLNHLVKYMKSKDQSSNYPSMLKYTDQILASRNLQWPNLPPEISYLRP